MNRSVFILLVLLCGSIFIFGQLKYRVKNKILCKDIKYVGKHTHYGWHICVPSGRSLYKSIVYSVGIGSNIDFDLQMINEYNSEVHGWDPTHFAVHTVKKTNPPPAFTFHRFGLGKSDGIVEVFSPNQTTSFREASAQVGKRIQEEWVEIPVLSFESMLRINKHSKIDILKIDIEGAEFDVIKDWYDRGYNLNADQILLEFHERFYNNTSIRNDSIIHMDKLGFSIVHKTKEVRTNFALRNSTNEA